MSRFFTDDDTHGTGAAQVALGFLAAMLDDENVLRDLSRTAADPWHRRYLTVLRDRLNRVLGEEVGR